MNHRPLLMPQSLPLCSGGAILLGRSRSDLLPYTHVFTWSQSAKLMPTLYHSIMHTFSTNMDYRNWAGNIGKNP